MRTYVINLARSAERRASITSQLTAYGIDFEFIEGVDGDHLDMTNPEMIAAIAPSFRNAEGWRPTLAACAMSHLSVYERVIVERPAAALVLEDDVQLPPDLDVLASATANQLRGAEIALLNFQSPRPIKFTQNAAVDLPGGRWLVSPVEVGQPVSAAAYVITREACERISKGQVPIRATSDDWAHFLSEGMLDTVRCIVPMAVATDPRFESTMGYNLHTSLKARLLRVILQYGPQCLRRAVSLRRQRIWRKHHRVEFVDGLPEISEVGQPTGGCLADDRQR